MKKNIKIIINFICIGYLLLLIALYFEKDSQYFPSGPPIGYTLNFNATFFLSFFLSLWVLFDYPKPKEVFSIMSLYGVLGLLIPTKECHIASIFLLIGAFILFLYSFILSRKTMLSNTNGESN